jgi:hypothetical protein
MAPRRKWKAAPAAKKNLLTPQPPGPDAQVQEQLHWLADQESKYLQALSPSPCSPIRPAISEIL